MFLDQEQIKKEYMARIRNSAPPGVWQNYENVRSRYINESTWQNKKPNQRHDGAKDENMNQAQLEEINAQFDTKLVTTAKALKSIFDDQISALETDITKMKSHNAGGGFSGPGNPAHMNAFSNWAKTGNDSGLLTFQNAMSEGSNADGGYTVPVELDRNIGAIQTN
ncbi:MAG: phage major capsid protein, partial [Desulfuromonadaceae bacterium]